MTGRIENRHLLHRLWRGKSILTAGKLDYFKFTYFHCGGGGVECETWYVNVEQLFIVF